MPKMTKPDCQPDSPVSHLSSNKAENFSDQRHHPAQNGNTEKNIKDYLLEQWPYLTRYLEDGRLELSNNRAERSIKPFVMGRKNWLFANTPGGAQASAVIYSLIETAKENGLDPYRYLRWVLQNAPQLSETDETWAEKLLPARAPKECYMPHK